MAEIRRQREFVDKGKIGIQIMYADSTAFQSLSSGLQKCIEFGTHIIAIEKYAHPIGWCYLAAVLYFFSSKYRSQMRNYQEGSAGIQQQKYQQAFKLYLSLPYAANAQADEINNTANLCKSCEQYKQQQLAKKE